MLYGRAIVTLAALPIATSFELVINPAYKQNSNATIDSLAVDLGDLRNSRGFGLGPGDANFDGSGASYPAQFLPPEDLVYAGVHFKFPQYHPSDRADNVLAQGQVLHVPQGRYSSLHVLAAGDGKSTTGFLNATYADGTASDSAILVPPFWSWPYPFGGDIVFPYLLTARGINYNRSMIFHTAHWLDASKNLTSITLPNSSHSPPGNRMHIFAISLVTASEEGQQLQVIHARSTQTWLEGTNKTQIFEAIIANPGTKTLVAKRGISVAVEANDLETTNVGYIYRLRPGDQAKVQIGVINKGDTPEGTVGRATLVIEGDDIHISHEFEATFGIAPYEPTFESTYAHESPPWFSNGKFGIFIHWGVYSVPGWGNSGPNENYAEWYWWDMNQGPFTAVDTFDYHLRTYGRDAVYDDFINNFTADFYDPKDWVDLFADAGAQYFVITSKHHDGYALFDMPKNVTRRTSVALTPHRNLLQELFDAAGHHQPHLHWATYFSLPEWFHPDYEPLGFGSWPGGNASNPYTGKKLPYTGYVPVNDFVRQVIGPEMQRIAEMGTEIMWCDIGGPNMTAEFAAWYFNAKASQGKQVLTNNRCGTPGDFDTPEYARYASVQTRKWESNLGMDPYSYGYNRATPEKAYMRADEIVTSLVDIVSKNGNFLLDIGPMANGKKRNTVWYIWSI